MKIPVLSWNKVTGASFHYHQPNGCVHTEDVYVPEWVGSYYWDNNYMQEKLQLDYRFVV